MEFREVQLFREKWRWICSRIGSQQDGFPQAWEDAFEWLVDKGFECDDKPCYELYHNDASSHPQGKWLVDVCIPLKSKN